jgi:hypothetical protein
VVLENPPRYATPRITPRLTLAQRQLLTRQLRPFLIVPIGITILITHPRLLHAYSLHKKELFLYRHTPSPRRARSEATNSSLSPPLYYTRASLETQLSQEGYLYTIRGVADQYELVSYTLDTLLINKGAGKQKEVERRRTKAIIVKINTRGRSKR